jgi:TRAP transporter TAXI family solute receptor
VTKGSDIQATAETGNASVANYNLIAKGDIEIAIVQNDIAFWGFNGKQMFKEPQKNIRAIASLFPEHVHLILADNAIKKITDLKGKRVGVGAPGSGMEGDVQAIFQVANLKYSDMKVDYLDLTATTSRFRDNQIDAGFTVSGYPTASVMDLAATKEIFLMDFEPDFMAQLIKTHPHFVPSTIPAGTYAGINKDTHTPAVMAMLITHDKISEDVIYTFTKTMFENLADIQGAHAKGKEITLKTALDGLTVPLHPGAAKYFKEKGLAVQ